MVYDYDVDFANTDFREHPELYQVGAGEQGVLSVQPYRGEILPHWQFKTPAIARQSNAKILELFQEYRDAEDFVGMDMSRKFLQMVSSICIHHASCSSTCSDISQPSVHAACPIAAHNKLHARL